MIKLPNCDVCGKNTELVSAIIEGVKMHVCNGCSNLGKKLEPIRPCIIVKSAKEEILDTIVEDFPAKIRSAREKLQLTQEELAKKLNEKESVIHKLETGHLTPSLELSKKLEKHLNIKLTEQLAAAKDTKKSVKTEMTMTIGDLIKLD